MLTNQGCFGYYLHKIRKLDVPGCWYCGYHTDDALHTFFICEAWETHRSRVENDIVDSLGPHNIMDYMLKDTHTWVMINGLIHDVLKRRKEEARKPTVVTKLRISKYDVC